MYNVGAVHVLDSLADLPDEEDAVTLCQVEVVSHHTLEQLAARYTAKDPH